MTKRSVVHASFTLERVYKAPRTLVFSAFADAEKKKQWFGGLQPEGATLDFRIGGREHSASEFAAHGTTTHFRYDATYYDIVENERIVYAYVMDMNGQRISVSVATIEFTDAEGGTRLKLTEQGAFLDGLDEPKIREGGTAGMLDALARLVET